MQTERRVAANPQTKPTDLGCESADRLLSSADTIAIVNDTTTSDHFSFSFTFNFAFNPREFYTRGYKKNNNNSF